MSNTWRYKGFVVKGSFSQSATQDRPMGQRRDAGKHKGHERNGMAVHSAQRWQTKPEVNEMLPLLERSGTDHLQVSREGRACYIQMDEIH